MPSFRSRSRSREGRRSPPEGEQDRPPGKGKGKGKGGGKGQTLGAGIQVGIQVWMGVRNTGQALQNLIQGPALEWAEVAARLRVLTDQLQEAADKADSLAPRY